MKRYLAILLVILMMLLVISSCSQQTAKDTASTEATSGSSTSTAVDTTANNLNETGTLNLVWHATIGTDSIFESPWRDLQCLYPYMVFDTLLSVDKDGNFVPKLATDWTTSEDGLTYTFNIAQNVKWQDGVDFTAKDVVFSLNGIIADPNAALKTCLLGIAGATDLNEGKAKTLAGVSSSGNTVTIKLASPDSTFLTSLSQAFILPEHLLGSVAASELSTYEAYWKKPIGTGAYTIDKVSFPDYFTCVRNDNYFRAKAGIKNVLFTSYATGGNDAVVAATISGKLDYIYGNATNDISIAKNITKQNSDIKMLMMISYYTRFFIFNLTGCTDGKQHPGVQNETVRQAINLIIDKEAIAGFYGDQAVPLTTFINSSSPMYNDDIVPFKRDVNKAVEMLKKAKFDFSKTLRICYYYDDQTTADVMELIKQNLAEAGIKCETSLATGDLGAVLYKAKNYDIMYAGGTKSDPVLLYLPNTVGGGEDIEMGNEEYRKAHFNKLMDEYRATLDKTEKKKIADELQVEGMKYAITLPIYGLNKICMYNTKKLKLPEELFKYDTEYTRDYRFEDWSLIN